MKKTVLFCLALLAFAFPSQAQTMLQEKIESYNVQIAVNADSSIDVSEKIEYDFGANQRHGIFRNIPVEYKARGGNFNLRISDISVTDENGRKYDFQKSKSEGDIILKIGDPDSFVRGKKTYVIHYKIERAVNYFADHDELYWNGIGTEWPVPVANPSVEVFFPDASHSLESFQRECFVGRLGSKEACQGQEYVRRNNSIRFSSRDLGVGEGLTFVVGFSKGLVEKPSGLEVIMDMAKDNWIVFLPIWVFFGMLFFWYKKGRDPEGSGTIIAQFDAPDKLTPTQVGIIFDDKFDKRDVSAALINLAVNGYMKIRKLEKKTIVSKDDYEFEKVKDYAGEKNAEQRLMEHFFFMGDVVKLSSLKKKFAAKILNIHKKEYEWLVERGYFSSNPQKARAKFVTASITLVVLAIYFFDIFGFIGAASIILSGIVIGAFGYFMPRKTAKGVAADEHIRGLKLYLEVAEKDRIDFHNAPEKNPQIFEKLLPYAMVLGVERQWAKQFEGIYDQQPDWYSDPAGSRLGAFTTGTLLNDLGSFSKQAHANFGETSSGGGSGFGGGGFSGGGGGGGGGGSW
ncbi:MAG: hypothetical protein UY41_C0047G0002 [Candidatus Moranbacteria bacterium GW2011_GWE1_49_15]|nr:MAG: hypothetical protein UX75_C0050G0002 [Candidatus Moranbacteria bacterium GW2011_GWE2_47_10]KKW05550.1 MAG: hypothetical protein UY41_C0047G0002 [Candidatus Moranbacteria bacterium GW2011_GWE1_49_15]